MEVTIQDLRDKGYTVEIDLPYHATGEYWYDCTLQDKTFTIKYQKLKGWGLYTNGNSFGEPPDEVFATEHRVVKRILELNE